MTASSSLTDPHNLKQIISPVGLRHATVVSIIRRYLSRTLYRLALRNGPVSRGLAANTGICFTINLFLWCLHHRLFKTHVFRTLFQRDCVSAAFVYLGATHVMQSKFIWLLAHFPTSWKWYSNETASAHQQQVIIYGTIGQPFDFQPSSYVGLWSVLCKVFSGVQLLANCNYRTRVYYWENCSWIVLSWMVMPAS